MVKSRSWIFQVDISFFVLYTKGIKRFIHCCLLWEKEKILRYMIIDGIRSVSRFTISILLLIYFGFRGRNVLTERSKSVSLVYLLIYSLCIIHSNIISDVSFCFVSPPVPSDHPFPQNFKFSLTSPFLNSL